MRKFVMINTLAVIKITKKHDKHSPRQLQVHLILRCHSHVSDLPPPPFLCAFAP
jgi:hypothetical protein